MQTNENTDAITDVIIVGGGIIGLMSALELTRQDLKILIIEKGNTGQEASWAGGGILSALCPWRCSNKVSNLISWSQQAYPSLIEELFDKTGIDPELSETGLLFWNEAESLEGMKWCREQEKTGHSTAYQYPFQGSKAKTTPAETSTKHRLYLPKINCVRNPKLLQALRAYLSLNPKVTFLEQTPVRKLLTVNQQVKGVRTDRQDILAKVVLVAAGAWSGSLLNPLGLSMKIEPVLGQMISFQFEVGALKHTILDKGRYIIPRRDGLILVGSTLECRGFDKSVNQEGLTELRSFSEALLPALKPQPIAHRWAGLRPFAPQGPWIGQAPAFHGLYLNSGHYRNGLTAAPASARLISDTIMKDHFDSLSVSILDESDYRPRPLCLVEEDNYSE